mmetsp:Transcript_11654/g.32577  ORF Transcript_11654/g.32577 Transcript_11654/m.32577 type:complete len:293 (-) Transcript_11654:50-928(-)
MAAGGRRRCWPLVAAGAACTAALCPGLGAFAHGAQRSALVATRGRVRGATQLHAVEPVDIQIGGLENFTGNSAALWTTFLVVFLCFPGVVSTINRTGQAKYVEKAYTLAGTGAGGLEMRSIAGGVAAYFQSMNYTMQDSPQKGKIRFVGNLQGSVSQALYLTFVLFGAFASASIVLQALFPKGPLDLGPNFFFLPCLLSPGAGWYYWGRAFRRDIVELQLEMSDDLTTTTLTVLGNQETIEQLQTGVRFMSPDGKLLQLMEPGMEYQPGIFEDLGQKPTVYGEKGQKVEAAA